MFSETSRYFNLPTAEVTTPDGKKIVYVLRRFLPTNPPTQTLAEHTVTEGDRLDNITARYLGDPEQFWQVCDANLAMQPEALTANESIGRRLRIALPEGV